jgi:hypothetical protein
MSKETERMIADLIDSAEQFSEMPDDCAEQVGVPLPPDERGRPSQASLILQLASEFDLFHAPDGTAYADIYVELRRETYAILSDQFENLLKYRYFKLMSEPPMADAVRKARDVLAARAVYEGPAREVRVRVAGLDGALYVDLVDNEWNVGEITSRGWSVVQNPPVRLCRFPGMKPLPMPQRGGSIDILRRYLNVSREEDFVLIVSWLVAALHHDGPYPTLVLLGEQGTAKSTTTKILRALVDPNTSPIRSIPREERDLQIAAKHAHILAYDNLSSLPEWLSNCLCRLSTGGGQAIRQNYTDEGEVLFEARRPVIVNGIEQVVTRADLGDRSIFIIFDPITSQRRVSERELLVKFEEDRATILGVLLDMMVQGLRAQHEVKPRDLPRMADFATWAIACVSATWPVGTFEAAYRGNRTEMVDTVLNTDTVASAVLELAQTVRTMQTQFSPDAGVVWKGTASELLAQLSTIAEVKMLKDGNWPKTANALSGRLTRVLPFLRERGIDVRRTKEGHAHKRIIQIIVISDDHGRASASSAASATEADRDEDEADTTAQSEEARSVDRQRVDASVCEEGSVVDEEGNVIETPPPPNPAPGANTADAVISNGPEFKRRIAIRKPQKKISEIQVPDRKTVDADPST